MAAAARYLFRQGLTPLTFHPPLGRASFGSSWLRTGKPACLQLRRHSYGVCGPGCGGPVRALGGGSTGLAARLCFSGLSIWLPWDPSVAEMDGTRPPKLWSQPLAPLRGICNSASSKLVCFAQ